MLLRKMQFYPGKRDLPRLDRQDTLITEASNLSQKYTILGTSVAALPVTPRVQLPSTRTLARLNRTLHVLSNWKI